LYPTVGEHLARPGAIVVAHALRHGVHELDVEKDDRAVREAFVLCLADRVARVDLSLRGVDEPDAAMRAVVRGDGDLRQALHAVRVRLVPILFLLHNENALRPSVTPAPRLLPDVDDGQAPAIVQELRALARPGSIGVAGRGEIVADPLIEAGPLPGVHRLVARIDVGIEADVARGVGH
jgi:hypothetical protein